MICLVHPLRKRHGVNGDGLTFKWIDSRSLSVSEEDLNKGLDMLHTLKEKNKERLNRFVYPTGHEVSSWYHIARCQAKQVVRNLYLLEQDGLDVPQLVIDFANLIANLLFAFSVEVNAVFEVDEVEFISKSY